jgi:hypothetical protein
MNKIFIFFLVLVLFFLIDVLFAKIYKNPKVFYRKNVLFNYNAQTIPPIGIFIQIEDKNNEHLLIHEKVHWQQYRRTGLIVFYFKYIFDLIFFGYDKHPMEKEARIKSGESEFCIENCTYCVRNGLSNVVNDLNFRK